MRQTPGQAAFRRLQYAFGLLAGALIIVGVAGVLIGTGINRSAREKFVRDAIPLKARVQDLTLQMVNQETGVRGYLITANVVDLQPFRSGRAAAAADLEYINQRVGNHPILGRLVAVAMPQIDQLSTYFDAQIALAGRGPSGVAEARQRLAVGKELFDQFRVTADKMNRDMDNFVRDAQHNQDVHANFLTRVMASVGLIGLGVLGVLARFVPRRTRRLIDSLELNRRASEAAADRAERVQLLTSALSGVASVADVAEAFTDTGVAALGGNGGAIYLLNGQRTALAMTSGRGADAATTDEWETVPIGANAPVCSVTRTGVPSLLGSSHEIAANYPELEPLRARLGDKAWATLPLGPADAPIGAMTVSYAEAQTFGPSEGAFLQEAASRVTQAIDRARLYDAELRARTRGDRAAQRLHLLADVGGRLGGHLESAAIPDLIARSAVGSFADVCIVWMIETDRRARVVASAQVNPTATQQQRHGWSDTAPTVPSEAVERVLRDGNGVLVRSTLPVSPARAGLDDPFEPGSRIAVPLTARDGVNGVLEFIRLKSNRREFSDADLLTARELGRRVGAAIDGAQAFDREHALAQALQRSLLPSGIPEIPGVDLRARYLPAGSGSQVGGDFYDVFETGEGTWAVVLGDVCGKGAEAAAITGICRNTLRALAIGGPSLQPAALLRGLNEALIAYLAGNSQFASAVYAGIAPSKDGLRVTVARAGHPAPIVVRASGEIEEVIPNGGLLGISPDVRLEERQIVLETGDTMVLYTDGVTEARRAGQFFGQERLYALLREMLGRPAQSIASGIEWSLQAFQRGPLRDDVAVVVLRVVEPIEVRSVECETAGLTSC